MSQNSFQVALGVFIDDRVSLLWAFFYRHERLRYITSSATSSAPLGLIQIFHGRRHLVLYLLASACAVRKKSDLEDRFGQRSVNKKGVNMGWWIGDEGQVGWLVAWLRSSRQLDGRSAFSMTTNFSRTADIRRN